ncbi:hypothetical protein GCM10010116_06130 [Microbispora rosea subsp. aerata]|nr:hypothetical protein GCM10010116_06130 [Microbispora rosea subsp. aerata]GIH54486.1 hypothetical protein Mro02_14000 [Microbispora rosea subsp. aerata]GLJ82752.1 hypothetical protein GCM10017588_14780 [Microbispora rosea subsp. aerata]
MHTLATITAATSADTAAKVRVTRIRMECVRRSDGLGLMLIEVPRWAWFP